jgi:hypothetical protein
MGKHKGRPKRRCGTNVLLKLLINLIREEGVDWIHVDYIPWSTGGLL